MRTIKYLATALVTLLMVGCEAPLEKADFDYIQNPENVPAGGEISYLESEDQQTVTVRASVPQDSTLTDWGVVCYTDSTELKDYIIASALDADSVTYTNFEVLFSGLQSDVEYTFCTFVENKDGVSYGKTQKKSFTFATWKSLGKATYCDDLISGLFGLSPVTYQVEIQESEATPGVYRLVNPYGAAYPYNEDGDYDANNNYYLVINATDSNEVFLPQNQNLGIDWDYGFMGIYGTLEPGTLRQGKITFPAKGIAIYDNDNAYYANNNGAFLIAMPGVEITDYSINLEYTSRYTDITTGENYIVMNLTWGNDVEYAKVALIEGIDISNAIENITNGSIESTLATSQGEIKLPVSKDGVYTCVAVSYAKEAAQQSASTTCKIYVESIGIRDFCGGFIMTGNTLFSNGTDAKMEVQIERHGANNDSLVITGVDFANKIYASFDAIHSVMSIVPQPLDSMITQDGTVYDMNLWTVDKNGNLSESAILDFGIGTSGSLYVDDLSGAMGYVIYSYVLEAEIEATYGEKNAGFVDGYYNIGFSPTSMPITKSAKVPSILRGKQLLPIATKHRQTKFGNAIDQHSMVRF